MWWLVVVFLEEKEEEECGCVWSACSSLVVASNVEGICVLCRLRRHRGVCVCVCFVLLLLVVIKNDCDMICDAAVQGVWAK